MSGWKGRAGFGRAPAPRYSAPSYNPYDYRKKPARPKEVRRMIESLVHWCEANGVADGHAFSSKDPGKERIVRSKETGKSDQYGSQIVEDEVFYLCGEHSKGLFRAAADKAPKPITATLVD